MSREEHVFHPEALTPGPDPGTGGRCRSPGSPVAPGAIPGEGPLEASLRPASLADGVFGPTLGAL